jgi:hypothetical protein
VHAEFSVECGAADEVLEIPWVSDDGVLRYLDLKSYPELLEGLEETQRLPELLGLLREINSSASIFESAKCDGGFTRDLTIEDEVFGTTGKFWCYVDVIFSASAQRASLPRTLLAAEELVSCLLPAPLASASAEFLVRRCYSQAEPEPSGYYVTCYVFGYSDQEKTARACWGEAIQFVQNAFRQISEKSERQPRQPDEV